MPVLKQEDQILAAHLILRRQLYRQEDRNKNFSDAAILAMAELKPLTAEGCRALPDVTGVQIQKYAAGYIAVIRRHLRTFQAAPRAETSREVREILSSLEQQLIGISKRNRLLYTGKLRARTGVDMTAFASGQLIVDALTHHAAITVKQTPADHNKKTPYDQVTDLIREINRTARETGSFDLYAGYPFVSGKLGCDPFEFHAPLMLFPVKCDRDNGEIKLERDPSRSVLFNTNLAVAVNRLLGKMENIEQETLDDAAQFDLAATLSKYARMNVKIASGTIDPVPYALEEKITGDLSVKGFCVLGKFAIQSNALQRDFDRILQWQELPKSVLELVENVGKEDLVKKLEESVEEPDAKVRVRERDIVYINDLNASQERVLAAMQQRDRLVVSGPPGTGKSQVITSVIADFVSRGKSVLMVTEKKAALDVVKSRLGLLNDFCLQIDDAEDKNGFYEQILNMLNKIDTVSMQGSDTFSDAVEADLDRLRAIKRDIYTQHNGYRVADLYRAVERPDMQSSVLRARWNDIESSSFDRGLLSYTEFCAAGDRLTQTRRIDMMNKWLSVAGTDLSDRVRRDLKETEIGRVSATARTAQKRLQQAALMHGSKRKKEMADLRRTLEPELESIFSAKINRKEYEKICGGLDVLITILEDYSGWYGAVTTVDAFSAGERRLNEAVFHLAARWNVKPVTAYDRIRRYYICSLIEDFERAHRDELRDIEGFDAITESLKKSFDGKRKFTVDRLYFELSKDFGKVRISKRFGDMRRIAEASRRMSVVRYLQRFDNELFLGVKIWLLTPEMASSVLPVREGMFDLVVFDEASQLYVERAIPSLVRGKKILIVGDNKQLRPSSLGSGRTSFDEEMLEEEGIESTALEVESLLDLAEAKYDRIMLDAHYRSESEELIAFSNYAFYKGKLLISPNLRPVDKPIEHIKVKGGVWEKRTNRAEAERVLKLLKTLMAEKGDATLGVITFNANQRDLIENMLEDECLKNREFGKQVEAEIRRRNKGEDIGLFVKNIENVQGDERDIIIFSMGYARDRDGKLGRNFGWLNAAHGENRLNVAVTRAKKKIYFITSLDAAEFAVDDLTGRGPKLLKQYMAYAEAVSKGDTTAVKQVLSQIGTVSAVTTERAPDPYADVLEKEFKERGCVTRRDVGIGGMVLDIAVTYPDGRIEGYESDTDLYAIDTDTRSRDFHRRNYLMTRGWTVKRIWSRDVYEKSTITE